jgi:hypothetical protein
VMGTWVMSGVEPGRCPWRGQSGPIYFQPLGPDAGVVRSLRARVLVVRRGWVGWVAREAFCRRSRGYWLLWRGHGLEQYLKVLSDGACRRCDATPLNVEKHATLFFRTTLIFDIHLRLPVGLHPRSRYGYCDVHLRLPVGLLEGAVEGADLVGEVVGLFLEAVDVEGMDPFDFFEANTVQRPF